MPLCNEHTSLKQARHQHPRPILFEPAVSAYRQTFPSRRHSFARRPTGEKHLGHSLRVFDGMSGHRAPPPIYIFSCDRRMTWRALSSPSCSPMASKLLIVALAALIASASAVPRRRLHQAAGALKNVAILATGGTFTRDACKHCLCSIASKQAVPSAACAARTPASACQQLETRRLLCQAHSAVYALALCLCLQPATSCQSPPSHSSLPFPGALPMQAVACRSPSPSLALLSFLQSLPSCTCTTVCVCSCICAQAQHDYQCRKLEANCAHRFF